jgi:hypothetical protein
MMGYDRPPVSDYVGVTVILTATVAALALVTGGVDPSAASPGALIPPIVSLVALTFAVLVLTAVVRNLAVFRGTASARYYRDYVSDTPSEKLERPARTFNNLLQVPVLFYAACALMIATGNLDRVQVTLAWLFVALRVVHAFVYIVFNRLAYRFSLFAASSIVLGVLWARFAIRSWPGV